MAYLGLPSGGPAARFPGNGPAPQLRWVPNLLGTPPVPPIGPSDPNPGKYWWPGKGPFFTSRLDADHTRKGYQPLPPAPQGKVVVIVYPGRGPFMPARFRVGPNSRAVFTMVGTTVNSAGAPLGNCVVQLFKTSNDAIIVETTSDGGGNFTLYRDGGSYSPAEQFYLVCYLAGSPDVAGTSVNTLVFS